MSMYMRMISPRGKESILLEKFFMCTNCGTPIEPKEKEVFKVLLVESEEL